ncbi:putative glutathione S-transferase GSTF1 [Dichanthelium oligosanthes]|uniref:glutathione transferase n=1 Tax=Dichanthelium oligosanthes TaxID=888268 RepID=A0A1E5V7F9_9POAL|nr:putative glutathione S-transferase GSTF1 [Dichanthelium oligosanthes]
MPPVKVFGSAAFTNMARVLLCLEEVGAEYEIVDVDFHTEEHKSPESTSPETDGDLEGSAVVDAWLDVEALQYEPAVHAVFVQHRVVQALGGTPDEKVIGESVEKLRKVLEVYEARLGEHRYLAGDAVSLADLSHFPYTHYFLGMPYAAVFDAFPHVKAWWQDIVARPAVQKVAAMMDGRSD